MEKLQPSSHKKFKSTTTLKDKTPTPRKNHHVENNSNFYDFKAMFAVELSDLLSAENQIVSELPTVIRAVKNEKLKEALKTHLKETKDQVSRLKKIFNLIGETARSKTCAGMEGILKEGSELINMDMDPDLRDAFLISAAQRIEHYEMAAYGSARSHADLLAFEEVSDLLKETLDEEANADKTLTKIAEGTIFSTGVNKTASHVEKKEKAAIAA